MIILGFDPGTGTTGFGVISLNPKSTFCQEQDNRRSDFLNLKLIAYGTIETKANSYMPARLREIYLHTRQLIKKHKPDKIALESLFFFKNQKTAMSVSQARGVIMMACASMGVPVKEYPPLQVKSILCQNGRARKKEMQEKIKEILKLKEIPKPDDAADALATAICCAKNL